MSDPVRIPSDVERADKVLGPLTARQAMLVASGGLVLYAGFWAAKAWFSPLAYLALITPVAGVIVGLALGRREGVGMDRFALAAIQHAFGPKRLVHAPEGIPPLPGFVNRSLARHAGAPPEPAALPCRSVDEAGVLDLGPDGCTALATCSTVNLHLHNRAEQQALVGGFARWLNSLTGPVQILLRCRPVDLGPAAEQTWHRAPALPHPALEAAARAHADFLTDLGRDNRLLTRQVLLALREPEPGRTTTGRARQRLTEAAGALAAADIEVSALNGPAAAWTVSAACHPEPPADHDEEAVG